MQTVEIPPNTWVARLNEFASMHEGWLVSVEVFGPDIGAQPEVDNLPLLGISIDRIDANDTVAISLARSSGDHLTHLIHAVTRIYVERTDDGADAALEIESADGVKSVLRFRAAARPEDVDGIVRR